MDMNVKNAPLKVKEFHRNYPSAPCPVQLNKFTFIPIHNFTEPPVLNIPSWIDGKELADPWQHTRTIVAETPIAPIDESNIISDNTHWTASTIDNWNLPDPTTDPFPQSNDGWQPVIDPTPWDYSKTLRPTGSSKKHHKRLYTTPIPPVPVIPRLPQEIRLNIQDKLIEVLAEDAERAHAGMHAYFCTRNNCRYHTTYE
jgi:hypothetical protein